MLKTANDAVRRGANIEGLAFYLGKRLYELFVEECAEQRRYMGSGPEVSFSTGGLELPVHMTRWLRDDEGLLGPRIPSPTLDSYGVNRPI
jgi:hypothetical protein